MRYADPENFFPVQVEPCSKYCCRVIATCFSSSLFVAKRDAPSQVERMGLG